MMHPQFDSIDQRLRAIADEIARLQAEADELEVTKRVLARMGITAKTSNSSVEPKAAAGGGAPRPDGIPSNFDMVDFVLSDAEKQGKDGLTAGEIVKAISVRYWPGLVAEQIRPNIYTFAKNGRIAKLDNGKFKRISKNEGPADIFG